VAVAVCLACGEENPERFRLCGFCGAPLAPAPPPSVRKTVTAVFSDVTGSTALGERLDPEALRALMTRYFEEMRTVLERHGGTVEKFIGDAVVAVFGVPHVHEDDALRAVRAAAEMRERVVALNEELERDWGASIEVRTGVNTGEVVAGDPASGQSFATGDTVNVAARLEQAAEPGEILLGEPTYRLVRDAVEVEPVAPLALKGKTEGVPAWRLLSVSPAAPGLARRLDSPLVGRTNELELLEQAFRRAAHERKPQLVTVLGEAGVGKSRLTEELVALCGEQATVLRGHCLPYGEGITFWPVAEVLKQASGIDEEDSPEEARAKIAALLADGEDTRLIAERAAGALGLSETGGAIQETFWAVRKLLEALAGRTPVVVVFDDIHWAEASFLDLIEYLAGWTTDAPLLLLCLARPELLETRPTWESAHAQSTVVRLEPLTAGESEALVSNLIGQAQLAEEIAIRITKAAEGNPLFVEEFLRMLVDDGLLRRDNGRWLPAGELSEMAIPPSIAALLAARLDLLAPEERGVLERGSVVGQVFYWGAVAELTPAEGRQEVGGSLQMLVRKELIRRESDSFAGEDAFRFHHILIRDAAYGGLAKLERAKLHERFAGWLEHKAGERVTEYEEIVGYHLEQAYRYRAELGPVDEGSHELSRQAATRLAASGRRALGRGDMVAAANLLQRAGGLWPRTDDVRVELLLDLADALTELGDFHGGRSIATEAAEAAAQLGDPRLSAHVTLRRARLEVNVERFPPGWMERTRREAEGAAEIFREAGDEAGLAQAFVLLGLVSWFELRFGAAQALLEEALEHATRGGSERQRLRALEWLISIEAIGPRRSAEAIARCEEFMRQDPGNLWVESHALQALAALKAMRGDFDEARLLIARPMSLSEDLGLLLRTAESSITKGYVELLAGDPIAAEHSFRRSCEVLEQIGEQNFLASVMVLVARALYEQGRYDEAEEWTLRSEAAAGLEDTEAQAMWQVTRARILARRNEFDLAVRLGRKAVSLLEGADTPDARGSALTDLAEVLILAGRPEEAKVPLEEALAVYQAKGHLVGAEKARGMIAGLVSE
jgi:class 3 adenylate cyclase/tetratricopeptide (TPR) repeat protein